MTTKTTRAVVQYEYNKCGGSDMEDLKSNIDHYMELKGIRKYSHLLIDIAHELGMKGQEAYEFADKEKSNFSKMLKGERPLKYDFIIPLEKIMKMRTNCLLKRKMYHSIKALDITHI